MEFSGGGSTYSGSSIELCYWGEDVGNGADFSLTIDAEAADCDALFGEGATIDGNSVLTWDTRVVSDVHFAVGSGDGFEISCVNQSVSREVESRTSTRCMCIFICRAHQPWPSVSCKRNRRTVLLRARRLSLPVVVHF